MGNTRFVALDVARGLAILGMMTAHMFVTADLEQPGGVLGYAASLAHGRSAPLFALLAGVSLGLIADSVQRQVRTLSTNPRFQVRRTVAIRGLFLLCLAAVLALFNDRILLILDNYGLWFLLSLPLLFLPVRWLFALAGLLVVAGIPLFALLDWIDIVPAPVWDFVTGDYSLPSYLAYLLVGLALYRAGWVQTPITKSTWQDSLARRTFLVGATTAATALAAGTVADSLRLGRLSLAALGREKQYTLFVEGPSVTDLQAIFPGMAGQSVDALILRSPAHWQFWYECLVFIAPHTDSVLETVANLGWVVTLVSLLLGMSRWLGQVIPTPADATATPKLRRGGLVTRVMQILAAPIAALGSMPLTAYTVHIVWHAVTWRLLGAVALLPSFLISVPTLLAAAWLWRCFGPGSKLEPGLVATAPPASRAPHHAPSYAPHTTRNYARGPLEALLRTLSYPATRHP